MSQFERVSFQLYDQDGIAINATGGQVQVNTVSTCHKATLYDKNGVAATNPVTLSTGGAEFYVLSSVSTVDLYIDAPHGQYAVKKGVVVGGSYNYKVNTNEKQQVYVIPFSITDAAATVEHDTGVVLPAHAQVGSKYQGATIRTVTLESGKTIDVGTLSSQAGGDANGYVNANSLTNAAQLIITEGALYTTAGEAAFVDTNPAAVNISYTLSSATSVAEGFIILPVILETA
jgi:hypothetical protein